MIAWIKRAIARLHPPAPAAIPNCARVLDDDDIKAVEGALLGLLDAGIGLGPRYAGLSPREVARRIATHGEFVAPRTERLANLSTKELSIVVVWSQRGWYGLPQEQEFRNSALFEDHCYDGATEPDYEWVARRLIDLTEVWKCRSVTAALSDYDELGGRHCLITIDADPPIRPFGIEAGKDFDWRIIDRPTENPPPSTTRRYGFAGDGGAALILSLEPEEMQRLEARLGYKFYIAAAPPAQR